MRTVRLHLPLRFAPGDSVTLPEASARHVRTVLRLRDGDPLVVFDGSGPEFEARLEHGPRKAMLARIGDPLAPRTCESPLTLHLAQGISRGPRMDYTVQKATELGVHRITPLVTERSVVRLEAERAERRTDHWQALASGACEQSGRVRVPVVEAPVGFGAWLDAGVPGTGVLLDPAAELGPRDLPAPQGVLTLLVGPEGGLAPAERTAALERGFTGIRLGPRVLRTETAAVTALAALQLLWGDLGAT
ncbi:MAG: 16S rRNA (uracil(1498)-N(3))-methyltransferase [Ectothiorhodospiraceae bacterium]|nr:16S rRNA (uracil(1498)-N(3))-methyltransferase [Chromatiales bacterium]MCP5153269.1 16S rRNA (uracil(1498)-N(3))-methyltransferase [Ectothiorhodospiraceae bacterium]